jgi:TonB family protein
MRGRTKEEIIKVVNSSLKPIKMAFESELKENLCAHGKVMVRFVLREDGSIPKCKVVESSFCDSAFENELVKMVSNWKFPSILSTYDIVEIVFPFIFNRE